MQQMAEPEVAAEQQQTLIQHDKVDTEPALSPRPIEAPPAQVQQDVQERPIIGMWQQQLPPPPRAEHPDYQHRTTRDWRHRQMYEAQYEYTRTGYD